MMISSRRSFLIASAATVAAGVTGCQTTAAPAATPAAAAGTIPAPVYRVGDRWTYRVQDGFRRPVVWEEKHEVIAVGANGIRVRVSQQGPSVSGTREELWSAPGLVSVGAVFDDETRRFQGALQRFVSVDSDLHRECIFAQSARQHRGGIGLVLGKQNPHI